MVLEIEVDIQEEQDKHKEKAKQEHKFSLNYHAPPFVPRCAKQHAFEEARPKLPATTVSINPFAPPFVPRCGPRWYNFGRKERKEQALSIVPAIDQIARTKQPSLVCFTNCRRDVDSMHPNLSCRVWPVV